jgi:enamine deaminase RidA (YjgF/YER057c/UK114 family)
MIGTIKRFAQPRTGTASVQAHSRIPAEDERTPLMDHPEHIQFLAPATLAPTPGYTQVVTVTGGQTIYLAGQVALDTSRNLVGRGDFRAQAEQVFENIRAGLAAAGADFSHVVKLTMFVVDRSHLPILREVRDRYVNTQHPPASTAVEVRSLVHEDFLLEVEAIASLPA